MELVSLGVEAVWSAQRYSRELTHSVWSVRFYKHLLDVLANDTWRSYPSEAFGRPCKFEHLREFLTHKDGLGWPTVDEVLDMITIVSKCTKELPPEKNVIQVQPLQSWARDALKRLDGAGLNINTSALADPLPDPMPPPAHTGPGRGHKAEKNGGDNITAVSLVDRGTSATYLRRRLARDQPELLEQIGPGKPHRSVRSAAIAAGIVKPVPTIRLVEDLAKVAARIRKHLTAEQVQLLVAELTGVDQ
jgi:hypothetical protein